MKPNGAVKTPAKLFELNFLFICAGYKQTNLVGCASTLRVVSHKYNEY